MTDKGLSAADLDLIKSVSHTVAGLLQDRGEFHGTLRADTFARIIAAPRTSRPDPEVVARLIYFMAGDDLDAASALAPENDGHWSVWRDRTEGRQAFATARAILALFPTEGQADG